MLDAGGTAVKAAKTKNVERSPLAAISSTRIVHDLSPALPPELRHATAAIPIPPGVSTATLPPPPPPPRRPTAGAEPSRRTLELWRPKISRRRDGGATALGRARVGSIVVEGGACYVQIMLGDTPVFADDTPRRASR